MLWSRTVYYLIPRVQVSDLASTKSMEMENASQSKSPTNVPESTCDDAQGELFPTANHRQSLSGSTGNLPASTGDSLTLDAAELVKCRSTTPPGKRTRSHTWSQVKGLILKNVRENKKAAKNAKQTLSYPVSPSGGDSQPNQLTVESNSTSGASSDVSQAQPSSQQAAQEIPCSPSLSGSSSASSSPSFSRPTNLPFELEPSAVPVPPPRAKKKHHKSRGAPKKGKCVDLRSSQMVASGGAFTSMMKKFRKPMHSPKDACLGTERILTFS